MRVDFVHAGAAYLPELQAYAAFLQTHGHEGRVHRAADDVPRDARIVWWMCGRVTPATVAHLPHAFHVHEYASASTPPLAWLKDRVKHWTQARPDYRIFLNDWVCQRMGFVDTVPFELRDMGIAPCFFDLRSEPSEPLVDFVYLGEMSRLRAFLPVFDALAALGRSVLLIGEVPFDLQARLGRLGNVTFTGRLLQPEVARQLRRARYGLNLVPDQHPYNRQTSTKLLEYCACGLGVVSTDYPWVREFEQAHQGRFAFIPERASGGDYVHLLGPVLDTRALRSPDLQHLGWPRHIEAMKVWHHLGLTVP